MNQDLRKRLKEYINFRKKYINIERETEKMFHLEEIYKLGRQREKNKRAVLSLKWKKLREFDDIVLIRFGRKLPFEVEIKEGEIVLIVDEKFYKLRKNHFKVFAKEADKYPLWTVENIWKQFIDIWVNKPLPFFVLKDEVDIHLFVNDVTFRRQEEALDWMLKRKDQQWARIVTLLLGSKDYRWWIRWWSDDKLSSENHLKESSDQSLLSSENPLKKSSDKSLFNFKVKFLSLWLKFNQYQLQFIQKSLNFSDFLLLHWPFGTWKTTTLVWTILALVQQWYKLLVTADSNTAVDNILIRLAKLGIYKPWEMVRVWPFTRLVWDNLFNYSIYWAIEQHPKYKKIKQLEIEIEKLKKRQSVFQKPVPSIRRWLSDVQIHRLAASWKSYRWLKVKTIWSMSNWLLIQKQIDRLIEQKEQIRQNIISDIIENAKVVLSTNSMVFSDFIKWHFFDIAIIDEWSQATEPSTIMPIVLSNKFIIAWDHKQLPPTVLSEEAKPLKKSLFERLIELINKAECLSDRYHLLQIQYRMNEVLMQFPNKMFYDWKLKSDESVKNISLKDLIWMKKWKYIISNQVLYWFDVEWKQKIEKDTKSLYNTKEIEVIYKIVKDLINLWLGTSNIWIISPYAAQVQRLKNRFSDLENLEINTVDGFQWREKEVIIISWVRTEKLGFLIDRRRLNVAITRAKRLLINVWNMKNLRSDKIFAEYEKFISKMWNKSQTDE